jgi:hypothetical protein
MDSEHRVIKMPPPGIAALVKAGHALDALRADAQAS